MAAMSIEPTLVRKVANELRYLRFMGHKCCSKYKNPSKIESLFHHCDFPLLKNRFLKRLCFEATVKCSFSEHGCPFTGKVLEVSSHESFCIFPPNSSSQRVQAGDDMQKVCNSVGTRETGIVDDSPVYSMEELILAELKCPICDVCIKPPIWLCLNGHSFCTDCTERVQICAICRGPKSVEINISLGYFYLAVEVPCKNACFGCDERGKGFDVAEHEKNCGFNPRLCPLVDDDFCRWKGLTSNMADHCISEHPSKVFSKNEHKWNNDAFIFRADAVHLFHIFGLLFRCMWCICGNNVMFSLCYIQNEPIRDRFTYEMEMYICGKEFTSTGGECAFIDDGNYDCIYNDSRKLLNLMYDSESKRPRDFEFIVRIFDSTDKMAEYNY